VVAAAGRLVDWKGFDVLLAAWARLQGERSRRCLVIVGSGPEEHALRTIAGKLGVNDSVHFVPNSYDAADYLAAADLVVVPSDYEGMSNVLLEAMVAAVPVVATRVSGAVDLIIDRVNGCLVPPRDPEALAAAIDEMLRSPGRLGRRSRETVLAQCELRHVVDLYEQAFQHAARLRLSRRTFIGPSRYSAGAAQESTVCAESAE
jgi:glycosyltransferase involved in cell wall biosynthesis